MRGKSLGNFARQLIKEVRRIGLWELTNLG